MHFPKRPGNRLDLLIDGQHFFPAMLTAIENARRYILMEMYLFESGNLTERFIQALLAAVNRGVIVRLLLDDFGALGLQSQDRWRLRKGGVALAFYNPLKIRRLTANLHRDHRKLLLVDGLIAFTGGSGVTDDFDPVTKPKQWWHDMMLRIEGPVTIDWHYLFEQVWRNTAEDPDPLPPPIPDLLGSHTGQLVTNDGRRHDIQRRLAQRISRAQKSISISVAYFVPPLRIRAALRHAAKRGVDVHLIVPGRHTDHQSARYAGRRFYNQLLRSGVRIHEYTPRFTHVKLMICDDWVSFGSANLDHWTLRWNLEANLEVESTSFTQIAQSAFDQDLARSREIRLEDWQKRSRLARTKEWFWSLISGWLARLSLSKRN